MNHLPVVGTKVCRRERRDWRVESGFSKLPACIIRACTLVPFVIACSGKADTVAYGAFSQHTRASSSLQVSANEPPVTALDEQFGTDMALDGWAGHELGNTGGVHPFLTNVASARAFNEVSGLRQQVGSILWTGATGPDTHLSGSNRVEIDRVFTVIDGPGSPMEWYLEYRIGPYSSSLRNPVTSPVHSRGVEFLLTRSDGQVIAEHSVFTTGFTFATVYPWNTPASGTLAPGEYRLQFSTWSEWDATAQNGNGWSSADAAFVLGVIPAPSTLVSFGAILLFRGRKRG